MIDAEMEFNSASESEPIADQSFEWVAAIEPADRSFVETKGWRSPGDVLQSYRHLERLVGGNTVRLPGAEATPEEVTAFWSQLGRPDSPDQYDIPAPQDMEAYSVELADWFRAAAHECHMPAEMARRFHDKYVEKFISETSQLNAELAAEQQRATAELQAAWGPSYDRKRALADRALRALGGERLIEELRVSGLSASPALAEAFAAAGEQLYSEDGFLEAGDSKGFGHSPDSARQEILRLRADSDFMSVYGDRRHPGHESAQQRMDQLYAVAREGS